MCAALETLCIWFLASLIWIMALQVYMLKPWWWWRFYNLWVWFFDMLWTFWKKFWLSWNMIRRTSREEVSKFISRFSIAIRIQNIAASYFHTSIRNFKCFSKPNFDCTHCKELLVKVYQGRGLKNICSYLKSWMYKYTYEIVGSKNLKFFQYHTRGAPGGPQGPPWGPPRSQVKIWKVKLTFKRIAPNQKV